MLVGYARVSKNDGSQTLDLQIDALVAAGVDRERIYSDLASGKRDARPGLIECLKALRAGDTLLVWKLDRLGRDLKHLITVVEDLSRREIGFRVLTGAGTAVDTTSPAGKLVFHIFGALAEFERELIRERTNAGLKAARARGRFGGRPRTMDRTTLRMAMSMMADQEQRAVDIARQLKISVTSLYSYVNRDGTLKELGQQVMDATDQKKRG